MKKIICAMFIIIATLTTAFATEFSLEDIYKTPADFEYALRFSSLEKQVAEFNGRLGDPAVLKKAAAFFEKNNTELNKLYAFSYLSHADNTLDSRASERVCAVRDAALRYENAVAPLRTELAALRGIDVPDDSVLRELVPSLSLPSEIASIVLNADFNAITITRPDGSQTGADYSELVRALTSTDKDYRKDAYEAYYSALKAHRNTLSATMDAHISGRLRQAELRDEASTHEQQIFAGRYQMPPQTADVLIKTVYNTLGIYRRGGEIQAARMGAEKFAPYEVEPVSGCEEGRYSYDEAKELVLAALKPLGQEYLTIASRILESNHINVYPKEGKQHGAFCVALSGGIDPYIHLNFDGSLNSVSTLAHELGHAVHFVLSRGQAPQFSEPMLTTTETAAITNEILLSKYMIKEAGDFAELNCAAAAYADLISSTLYNQTRLFAFERAAYNLVQNGGTLTADKADELWSAISEPFWSAKVNVPEDARGAWSAVPHLYRDYYVANYAFSVAAAETFAEKILDGQTQEYIGFLSSGSSKPAYDLFLSMGVDFLGKGAYNDIVKQFDQLFDIIERTEEKTNAA